ncbi:uncharacterized protein LOC142356513, partial [Convolutriloba macropyga]|uniref:uncharacterized protein LOC142356513 n=1 Tax=Convolutriloba macropyga TaxID=536237 RepID=UPI003F51C611
MVLLFQAILCAPIINILAARISVKLQLFTENAWDIGTSSVRVALFDGVRKSESGGYTAFIDFFLPEKPNNTFNDKTIHLYKLEGDLEYSRVHMVAILQQKATEQSKLHLNKIIVDDFLFPVNETAQESLEAEKYTILKQ